MNIVKPSATILTDVEAAQVLGRLEAAGRTAYKSEALITPDSAEAFIRKIIKSGHESVLEHESISVRIVCDRGVSHELVRHRIAAYTQESTQYVNYAKRGMEVIEPCFWEPGSRLCNIWLTHMAECERTYNHLIELGANPQEARSVLPNSLKTEVVATMNLREWRHVMRLRTAPAAHPQMREVMIGLLGKFKCVLPVIFEDIDE